MIVWTCDFRENSGEGKLARLFLKQPYYKKINLIKVYSPEANYVLKYGKISYFKKKNYIDYDKFYYKYIYPFIGCFYSWYFFFKKEKFVYLNYLPLWNFIILLLLAPKTVLGPITGSSRYGKSFLRNSFPLVYKLSKIILSIRYNEVIFATDNLKKYFKNGMKNKNFNFVLNYLVLNKKKVRNKSQKIVIYYRKHKNKNNDFFLKLVKFITKKNIEIYCIGDKIANKNVKNFGFVSHKKNIAIIKKCKLGINSSENFFSFFMMDCLNSSIKVLCDSNSINGKLSFKKNVLLSNYNNFDGTLNLIYAFMKKR